MPLKNWLTRVGLALLQKSDSASFSTTQTEQLRKFIATHPDMARAVGYSEPSYSGKNVNEY